MLPAITHEGRGSGRTYRQLEALPDGGVFIVHTGPMRDHVRSILQQQGRSSDAVRVHVVERMRDLDKLRGLRVPIDVDHWAWENFGPEVVQGLRQHLDRIVSHA